MSNTELRFARRAQRHVDDIAQFTFEQFGIEQVLAYEDVLFEGFEHVRSHPGIGRLHASGERELVVGSHVVLYRYDKDEDVVTVLRVRHPRRFRGRCGSGADTPSARMRLQAFHATVGGPRPYPVDAFPAD